MHSDTTMVPYGDAMVAMPTAYELGSGDPNDSCPFCCKDLEWSAEFDDDGTFYPVFSESIYRDDKGVQWCSEGCALLHELNAKDILLKNVKLHIIMSNELAAATTARALVKFSRAWGAAKEIIQEAF